MPADMMIRRLRVNSVLSEDDAAALRALPLADAELMLEALETDKLTIGGTFRRSGRF